MAILSISDAARAAGVARSTLQRAIKEGRLSATRQPNGSPGVDTSELIRVYGELKQGVAPGAAQDGAPGAARDSGDTATASQPATGSATAGETVALQVLQAQVDMLQEQLDAALEREQRLLKMLEDQQQRLLPAPKRGVIERLADAITRVRNKS